MSINPAQFSKFDVPLNKVLSRLGFASGKTKIGDNVNDILSEEINAAKKLFVPRQVVATSAIKSAGGKLKLVPSFTISSADILALLNECGEAAGFAVTIGPALEARRDKYIRDRETTRALILDALGSVAVEELADITNKQIKDEAANRGFTATRRFSPGYGDWALASQKDLLSWLGADQIDIKLTETFQMIPEKSVSALIGLKSVKGYSRNSLAGFHNLKNHL